MCGLEPGTVQATDSVSKWDTLKGWRPGDGANETPPQALRKLPAGIRSLPPDPSYRHSLGMVTVTALPYRP